MTTGPADFDARDSAGEVVQSGDDAAGTTPSDSAFGESADAVEPEFLDDDAFRHIPQGREIGPGMWESIGWIVAFFVIEIFGGAAWSMMAGLIHVATEGGMISTEELNSVIARQTPYMLGAIKFVEVLFVLAAIRWRFGRGALRLTGFRPIPPIHVAILALAVLPTAVFSGQLYALFMWVAEQLPFLKTFTSLSSMEAIQEMARTTPVAVLMISVAVLPALNEEFLFRGLIGRGLVGRYGVIAGISLTSLLFAAVHLSPMHAVALIPLAVVMHVAYLSSGSIWLPVLVHFINNALSVGFMVIAVRMEQDVPEMSANALDGMFDPATLIASACCVASAVWLLWRLRIQWRLPGGDFWTSLVPGVAPPPIELNAQPSTGGHVMVPALALILGLMLFTVAYGVNAWRFAQEAASAVGF